MCVAMSLAQSLSGLEKVLEECSTHWGSQDTDTVEDITTASFLFGIAINNLSDLIPGLVSSDVACLRELHFIVNEILYMGWLD